MQYSSVKGISGWSQFLILLAFVLLGICLTAAVEFILTWHLLPAGVSSNKMSDELLTALARPENVGTARLLQILGTFSMLFVPAFLFALVVHGRNPFWLGFNKKFTIAQIIIGVVLICLANLIAAPLTDLTREKILVHLPSLSEMASSLEASYNKQVAIISNLNGWKDFVTAIIIMAFLPAMFEEIFFRGVVQNLFTRWWKMPLLSIIVTSVIFSLVHLSIYLFLARFALGFALGMMYERSKNLWINIIAHFLNNAFALSLLFWSMQHDKKMDIDKMDAKMPLWVGLIVLIIAIGLFFVFDVLSRQKRKLIEEREHELLEANSLHHSFREH